MLDTIISLDPVLEKAIADILMQQDKKEWIKKSQDLHIRYTKHEKERVQRYIRNYGDAIAYLALRFPATYAQISGALAAVQKVIPSWQPKKLLDIGSGPGTGLWATTGIFPTLRRATCIDQDKNFLVLGKTLLFNAPLSQIVSWEQRDITEGIEDNGQRYDIVLIANVLNELSNSQRETLLTYAFHLCSGIVLIVEPGTPLGSSIVQAAAEYLSSKGTLLAPYIDNTLVVSDDYWLHFPQRFKRPEFERRIRQHMRDSNLMASDWENAKYSYVAVGKIPPESTYWGRCVGPVHIQKGYLEVPILTKDHLLQVKVMKRNKEQYTFAKRLQWSQLIEQAIG